MENPTPSTAGKTFPDDDNEGLRQALLRVTKPGNAALKENLEALRAELLSIADAIHQAEEQFQQREADLSQRDQELYTLLQQVSARQARLAERISPLLVPLLHQNARDDSVRFGEAIAPVIGPAIRHQIRDAKQDIIDALYPLIGQIIGKAISEALRELTRTIDARIRQQKSLGSRLNHMFARLKGVSEAEIALRDALPYRIHRILLVHRKTGLLLEHISQKGEREPDDLNIISSMLTAIRDFVHDSFTDDQGELEEITYGDQRILLEAGQNAYLAVAIAGVEPQGYHQLIRNAVNKINVDYEKEISNFDGDVQMLPDFRPVLLPVLLPEANSANTQNIPKLSRYQKLAVGLSLFAILFLLALLSFACLFTVRLWPLVF